MGGGFMRPNGRGAPRETPSQSFRLEASDLHAGEGATLANPKAGSGSGVHAGISRGAAERDVASPSPGPWGRKYLSRQRRGKQGT